MIAVQKALLRRENLNEFGLVTLTELTSPSQQRYDDPKLALSNWWPG
jgi:hypothetical protein